MADDARAPSRFVAPMKAVSGQLPADDGTWAAELKWDGMRVQFHSAGRGAGPRLFSSRGMAVTTSFPELHPLAEALGVAAVLDGEVVVLEDGRPSFARLQERIHLTDPSAEVVRRTPVFYFAFDLLELDGRSLTGLPYDHRRRLLGELVPDGPAWRVPTVSFDDPTALFDLAGKLGLEGVVCKRRTSLYRPGRRSADWVKVKIRSRQEFIVIGWMPSKVLPTDATGLRADRDLGSLLLAVHDDDGNLRFCGAAGSGLTGAHRRQLAPRFRPAPPPVEPLPAGLDEAAGPGPQWIEPTVVVEVEYSLWPEGGTLWHPVFRGIRIDRDPDDVRREEPPNSPGPPI